ncbi:YjgF-like protein [Aspergillus fijiensis CBS 313.89]|uniref:YjgF-like protein n=1 Tax=Aspergillus fijiensis CBS 313.89 TaxID=1448319 RepID=A0A8G1VY94_9EURO|nr:YjgF-like protein [Aspergillus fijiensis CBS 313.89]RAK76173.1 YjgF-like protein [Aspergillus fijiensis CBS 313.89]
MSKRAIRTDNAPAPKPFFSQAIVHEKTVYTSGAVGMDPATGRLVEGTTGDRTVQCLKNLSNILEAAGSCLDNIIKATIFIDDMSNYGSMNEAYLSVFSNGSPPARTCVAVKQLPLGTDVEIEVVAHL